MAIQLASSGAKVVVNYFSNAEVAERVVDEIRQYGGEAVALQADVRKEEEVNALIANIKEHYGQPVDVLVNNATGPQPELSLEDVSWEDYLNQLEFFVKAPLLLVKAVMGDMKEIGYGRIVNIGSEVVELGNAHFSNYVTAKSSMVGMTRSWANELGEFGITVNMVHPGFIPVERHGTVSDDTITSYTSDMALQRMGNPKDIADTVSFLCSDQASFMTGQILTVNGGKTFGM
ncbi:SDR family oxidoreductase [Halobacillus fulvus]|nr:SDR family oxidoreductase [Halobacillus fulvus]